jgi:hypothetical protein
MVTDADISVVVQGPVGALLPDVLESVRTVLPGAELVVSTWKGSAVAGLDADAVIENDDPGSVALVDDAGKPTKRMMNVNRMLASTAAGLAGVERPWAVKLRSDTPVESAAFLDWIGRFPERVDEMKVFGERVLCPLIATRPGTTAPGYLFHPSDCVHVGRTEDLRLLWASPPVDEAGWTGWLVGRPRPPAPRWGSPRYFNEQVMWLGCLSAAGVDPGYEEAGVVSDELIRRSDLSIVNNFVVLEPWQLGIRLPTLEPQVSYLEPDQYLWHDDWLHLYQRHILG